MTTLKLRIPLFLALGLLSLAFASHRLPAINRAAAQTRTVRVVTATAPISGTTSMTIELAAQGNENAIGFSLTFNPAILSNPQATLGSGAAGASLNVNPNQAAQGRLGIALALATGQVFAAGARQLVVVNFNVASGAAAGATPIGFGDQPIVREVSGASADPLATTFTPGSVTIAGAVASVSAASFTGATLAAESIVAAFGAKLATGVEIAATTPLPTTLAGTTVKVKDSAGTERLSPLFFVAPGQINYQLPPSTANGAATITATSGDGSLSLGTVQVAAVAPGLFAANANGQGVAAAVALRVKADGAQVSEPVAQFDGMKFVSLPIDLGPAAEQVYLILFGTGERGLSGLTAANLKVGGTDVPVLFVGVTPGFVGLDQVNAGPLPRSLTGRGEVDVVLTLDGKAANTVRVSFK